MKRVLQLCRPAVVLLALVWGSCSESEQSPVSPAAQPSPVVGQAQTAGTLSVPYTVFATGLNNPRGIKFGPNGFLYVAEGGAGGTDPAVGPLLVPPPVGPYTGGMTARISKFDRHGNRITVADNLPSDQTAPPPSFVSGVADVAFLGGKLFALLSGAGPSHGVPSVPNGVIRVKDNGSWRVVADLSAYLKAHPVAHPEPDDFEPDGTPYSMVNVGDDLFVIEPNHGELVKIEPREHEITRIVDISASQGHIVPTAMVYHDGYFYVGNLSTFPVVPGASKILRISRNGQVQVWKQGFTTILGLAFDRSGLLYVLETITAAGFPVTSQDPGAGRVVRVNRNGTTETIADGLFLPTAMTFGPDGMLYISNKGFGPPPIGLGEILRLDVGQSQHGHNDRDISEIH